MGVLANSRTFGAIATKVERAVKAVFLPDPDAIVDFGYNRTANRTVRTN